MNYDDITDNLYPAWHARALCNGMDPEIFFPTTPPRIKGKTHRDRRLAVTREARKTCKECPVRRECRDDARAHNEQWGIWGGIDLEGTRGSNAA